MIESKEMWAADFGCVRRCPSVGCPGAGCWVPGARVPGCPLPGGLKELIGLIELIGLMNLRDLIGQVNLRDLIGLRDLTAKRAYEIVKETLIGVILRYHEYIHQSERTL